MRSDPEFSDPSSGSLVPNRRRYTNILNGISVFRYPKYVTYFRVSHRLSVVPMRDLQLVKDFIADHLPNSELTYIFVWVSCSVFIMLILTARNCEVFLRFSFPPRPHSSGRICLASWKWPKPSFPSRTIRSVKRLSNRFSFRLPDSSVKIEHNKLFFFVLFNAHNCFF